MNMRSLVLVGLVAATLPMLAQTPDTIRSGESGGWGPAAVAGDNLFDGYFRTGAGTASVGGEMVSFDLGRNGHYRLGNEADSYGEIGWNKKVYDKDGCAFFVHAMINWDGAFKNGIPSTVAPGVNMEQAWTEAKGVLGNSDAFKDASVWMGERFYDRQDVHMLDWKYLHHDGEGAGIEDINLGFGKLAYAYLQYDNGATGFINNASTTTGVRDVTNIHHLKLTDVNTNPGGKLYVSVEFDTASPYKGPSKTTAPYNNYTSNDSNNKGGVAVAIMHSQDVLGGGNHLVFQYGTGAATGLGNGDQFNRSLASLNSGNKVLRVTDELSIQPTKTFGAEFVAAIEKNKLDNGAGSTANASWTTIGFRPKVGLTDHFSIEGEFGWEKTTMDVFAGVSTPDKTLNKETIALEWTPTTEFWSRPSMRVFFTNASWNNGAQGTVGGVNYADKTSGSQYGVQTEVWF
jgi:maltoporin